MRQACVRLTQADQILGQSASRCCNQAFIAGIITLSPTEVSGPSETESTVLSDTFIGIGSRSDLNFKLNSVSRAPPANRWLPETQSFTNLKLITYV
jgi:hypothetical protein